VTKRCLLVNTVHPRVCGASGKVLSDADLDTGLSPHLRGIPPFPLRLMAQQEHSEAEAAMTAEAPAEQRGKRLGRDNFEDSRECHVGMLAASEVRVGAGAITASEPLTLKTSNACLA
jgi:hypothetical protein